MEYTNIDQKINSIENTMKSLMNKNTVVYSNHSKTSDTLSNGICSLTINSINKSFIFTYAKNNITISPLNNSITNLQFINEISVDDLITAKNIMNNQYLIDTFSNINKILAIYQKYVKIENETVMINKLLINGVDIEKELSDLNRYVDRYIEDADVKFEVINESILNLNNNTITVNEEISDINDKYTEFREEFKNHTHDGQYVKPVDIEELRTKMTGIEYNKVKIGTVEEEEVYEINTSFDHDLKVNGYINGIDITKLLKLENDALIIKDILSFNSLINLVIDTESGSDDKLIIRFPNDNSIVFESSGIISSVTSKGNKFYYDNFLTKQMLIDDEDIIDILFNKITDENGNTTSSPKKSAVEQIFDIIDFGLTILDTAATVGPMIAQIKKFGWTGYLYKTFGIVSSKSGGYIPLELTVMTRSVIIDDSTNTDNVESYESPNYEDVDEDFNEFQYVANLFPSIDKIFASLKRYYSNVEKGQRTNYLGLLLVDAQIHDKLMNHTHDEFALIDHVHSYNDLTDVPETFTPTEHNHDSLYSKLDHTHTTFNNNLTINSNQESTSITIGGNGYVSCVDLLGESELDLGVGGYDLIIKNNAINYNGSMNLITLNTSTINSCQISDTFTLNAPYIQTVGWFPFNVMMNVDFHNQTDQNYIWRLNGIDNSFTLQKYGNDSIFEFSIIDSSHPLYTAKGGSENSTGFCIKNSSTNNWWRFATAYNSKAHEEYLRLYWNKIYLCYFENCDDDVNQLNTTITHNAPLEECLDIFELGCPVFMSGEVYNLKNGNYTKETNTIDCIPSVKSTGTYKEFLGIVVNKHKSGDKVKIGDVMKKDVIINQDTIDFATHGDYYFRVDDSSKYKIGDTVLYDGSIIDDDVPITNKIIKSTIGSITGIINEHYVSVFKS